MAEDECPSCGAYGDEHFEDCPLFVPEAYLDYLDELDEDEDDDIDWDDDDVA